MPTDYCKWKIKSHFSLRLLTYPLNLFHKNIYISSSFHIICDALAQYYSVANTEKKVYVSTNKLKS